MVIGDPASGQRPHNRLLKVETMPNPESKMCTCYPSFIRFRSVLITTVLPALQQRPYLWPSTVGHRPTRRDAHQVQTVRMTYDD